MPGPSVYDGLQKVPDLQGGAAQQMNPQLPWAQKAQSAVDDWLERNVSTPMFNAGLTNLGPETGAIGSAAASLVLPRSMYDIAPMPPWMKVIQGEGKGVEKAVEQVVKPMVNNGKKRVMTKDEVMALVRSDGGRQGGGLQQWTVPERTVAEEKAAKIKESGLRGVDDQNSAALVSEREKAEAGGLKDDAAKVLAQNHVEETLGEYSDRHNEPELWASQEKAHYSKYAGWYDDVEKMLGRKMSEKESRTFTSYFSSLPGQGAPDNMSAEHWEDAGHLVKPGFESILLSVRKAAEK